MPLDQSQSGPRREAAKQPAATCHQPENENTDDASVQSREGASRASDDDIDDGTPEAEAQRPDLERGLSRVSTQGEVYTIFTKPQRLMIVCIAVFAGFISPLSANTYFPALNSIASSLGVTIELVNLTLTTYMIMQGIAPSFIGGLADAVGRRPAYILTFVIYVGANIGLALQNSYTALMILRALQSAGSSGTIALTYGTVADISPTSERGKYMGWVGSGLMLGPAVGPVIGGLLSQFLGWHSIFWFLTILSSVVLLVIVLLLPETGRNVVGNGSIPPPQWNMSLVSYVQLRRTQNRESLSAEESRASKIDRSRNGRIRFPNPLRTLLIVCEKDASLILLANSIINTAFFCLVASIPTLFNEIYGFNDLQTGFCFIPFGVGCAVSSIVNGRLLDWNFRRIAKQRGFTIQKKRATDLRNFPIEQARLQIALPCMYAGICVYLTFGWLLDFHVHYLGPLILLFGLGLTVMAAFTGLNTLLVDLHPQCPATATAANNLVRCLMAAGGTALINKMLSAMTIGGCYTFIAGVVGLASIALWAEMRWGPKWREERYVRLEKAEAKKQAIPEKPNDALPSGTLESGSDREMVLEDKDGGSPREKGDEKGEMSSEKDLPSV